MQERSVLNQILMPKGTSKIGSVNPKWVSIFIVVIWCSGIFCQKIFSQKLICDREVINEQNLYSHYADSMLSLISTGGGIERYDVSISPSLLTRQVVRLVTIPIFDWKSGGVYTCGQFTEELLDVKVEPRFQRVIGLSNKGKIVGSMSILVAYMAGETGNEGNVYINPLPGNLKSSDRTIVRYLRKFPNRLVFIIRGLEGVWTIRDNQIYQITSMVDNRLTPGREVMCALGQDWINDLINKQIRTNFAYLSCQTCRR
jgi:hypothetical protein